MADMERIRNGISVRGVRKNGTYRTTRESKPAPSSLTRASTHDCSFSVPCVPVSAEHTHGSVSVRFWLQWWRWCCRRSRSTERIRVAHICNRCRRCRAVVNRRTDFELAKVDVQLILFGGTRPRNRFACWKPSTDNGSYRQSLSNHTIFCWFMVAIHQADEDAVSWLSTQSMR